MFKLGKQSKTGISQGDVLCLPSSSLVGSMGKSELMIRGLGVMTGGKRAGLASLLG